MDWSKGYSCRWRAYEVDVPTWADGPEVGGVLSAAVERDCSSDAALLESGDITLDAPVGGDFGERYVRLAMVAEQAGEVERVDVCTLLCSASGGTVDRGSDEVDLEGRSVLWPASTARLPKGAYVPLGTDGVEWCRGQLASAISAPVAATGSFELSEHYVFDPDTSVLDAVWLVLRAGGFCAQIDGDGTVRLGRLPTDPAVALGDARAALLLPGVTHALDWSEVPNRYWALDGRRASCATNDDPLSPTSVVARGYYHDVVDESPVLVGGESLGEYCARRLAEMSAARDVRSYTREMWPGVTCFSLVRGSVPSVGLEGDLRVERQSLACGAGVVVTERAYREVRSWPV